MAQTDPDGLNAAQDTESITDLDRGTQLILDAKPGRFTLFTPIRAGGTVVGWEVLDEDLTVHKLRVVKTTETFLHFIDEGDEQPVYNESEVTKIHDYRVVGEDFGPIQRKEAQILD